MPKLKHFQINYVKKPWELILSFNKSTDKLRVIERKFKKKFYSLRIIDASKKQGLSYTRNIGAKFAEGDTFAFCDADAEVDKNWLKALSNALSKHDVACGRNLLLQQ
jgi:glycosyltransferase involved in cell wall biosynthesis